MSGTSKPNVAFICVHNSCRSQIAEALGKELACDVFASYSAGTERQERINQDAVRLMKQSWGIDMEKTQCSKLLEEIPQPDIGGPVKNRSRTNFSCLHQMAKRPCRVLHGLLHTKYFSERDKSKEYVSIVETMI